MTRSRLIMRVRRLWVLTVLGPVVYLIAAEALAVLVLHPLIGNALMQLLVILALPALGLIPFLLWSLGTIERQERDLIQGATLLQNVKDYAIFMLDPRGRVASWTPGAESITGYTAEEIIGQHVSIFYPAEDIEQGKPEIELGAVLENGRSEDEGWRVGNDGRHFWVNTVMTALYDDGRRLLGFTRVTRDMSDRKRVEEQVHSLNASLERSVAELQAANEENARLYDEARAARDRLQVWNAELEAKVAERARHIEQHSKDITTRVLRAQEDERKRIARELHDDTAQSLSTLLVNLDLLEPHIPDSAGVLRSRVQRISVLLQCTLDRTRVLAHDLRPMIIDDIGLVAALQGLAEEHEGSYGVPVNVRVTEIPTERLAPDLEIAFFRIAQEALVNSGRHGQARWVRIELSCPGGVAKLVIRDDGKGFLAEQLMGPTRQGGLGLHGMKERAELLGGTFAIDAVPGQGTCITVTAPRTG